MHQGLIIAYKFFIVISFPFTTYYNFAVHYINVFPFFSNKFMVLPLSEIMVLPLCVIVVLSLHVILSEFLKENVVNHHVHWELSRISPTPFWSQHLTHYYIIVINTLWYQINYWHISEDRTKARFVRHYGTQKKGLIINLYEGNQDHWIDVQVFNTAGLSRPSGANYLITNYKGKLCNVCYTVSASRL